MDLIEYYKYYYKKTIKSFPDETPYARGINISKKNRKQHIIFGYIFMTLILYLSVVLLIIFPKFWIAICVYGSIFFLYGVYIIHLANYNLITIYRCYKISMKDDIYSKFLKSSWFDYTDYHTININFNIIGLKHERIEYGLFNNHFNRKYIINYETIGKVVLIMTINKAILKYKGCKRIYNKKYDKLTDLFNDMKKELL